MSPRSIFALSLAAFVVLTERAPAQPSGPPLSAAGLNPVGVRGSVTKAHVTLEFSVTNHTGEARTARVTAFYPERSEVRYARDVWVPARARATSYLTVGPAPPRTGAGSEFARELKFVLADRTGGTETVILPTTSEHERSRVALYKKRDVRDPVYALFADSIPGVPGETDAEVPEGVIRLARTVRASAALSEHVSVCNEGPLGLASEALEGMDVAIVAGDRLARDPAGLAALRRWVEAGGRAWVMLDRTNPGALAPLTGDPVPVVERVGLTRVALRGPTQTEPPPRLFEVPVPHARVVPAPTDRVLLLTGDWPAAFVRRVGRGRIMFTTLGSAAWERPRGKDASPFKNLPDFPQPDSNVITLLADLVPSVEADPFPPEVFAPLLLDDVGYTVVGRGTALLVLGAFVVALAFGFAAMRRSRRPGLAGWAIPLSAALACGALVVLGERARRSVPPAVGVSALVEVVPGTDRATATGVYAVYNPAPGPVALGTAGAAQLGLDDRGLDGLARTRAETDAGEWKWDGLALPAGARTGPFRASLPAPGARVVARFGPNGIEGTFAAGPFRGPTDLVFSPQSREPLSVQLGTDGAFTITSGNALPPGEFLPGALLSDKQQRRQDLYRQLHAGKPLQHYEGRDVLFAWTDPVDPPLLRAAGARVVGGALLALPVEFERPAPGSPVVVPRGLAPFRRLSSGNTTIPAVTTGTGPVNMRLRFQLPASVLPVDVERATVFAQVRAPFRRATLGGVRDGTAVPAVTGPVPVEPFRFEIADKSLLRTDADGGLLIDFVLSAADGGSPDTPWKIESLALEVTGRTAAK